MYPSQATLLIKIQEVSYVPNTPNTMANCIGALVRRRDSKMQVIWIVKGDSVIKMAANEQVATVTKNGVSILGNKI